ncbi:hypothetical protein BVG16_26075 [Paenibacillus selenitireducens]|uniref:EfeO-type cupredoxin-like domain-containing protein n=1 Tax=Paenibacillus selenitireducens TaxID=1324314 RepID=A0A1T2X220_9BACL|nr:hypothetical protein [Paenibacillus selenitireducens]OPA73912.1 hypothetical protein BVG16_26075 [Paenibacillus selenitireducens]
MLLNYGSLTLVILITMYIVWHTYRMKGRLHHTAGSVICIIWSILTSVAFGIAVTQIFIYQLWPSLSATVAFAIIAGFGMGRPLGVRAGLHGIIGGITGGILGTIFGLKFFATDKIVFMTMIVFIVATYAIMKFMEKNISATNKITAKKKSAAKKPSYAITMIFAIIALGLAGFVVIQKDNIGIGQIGQPNTQNAVMDEENDLQTATVRLTKIGFVPKNTDFVIKSMAKLIIEVEPEMGAGHQLISETLGINAPLVTGQNVFLFNNPHEGTFSYHVDTGEAGSITVK